MASFFSIILATFNAENTLRVCLDSLRAQTFRDFEVIVSDGLSIDSTLSILNDFRDLDLKISSEKDEGIYDAWNKALKRISGKWVYFIGADDFLWTPSVLAETHASLAQCSEKLKLWYAPVNYIYPATGMVRKVGTKWDDIRAPFFKKNCIPHQGVFHHQSLFRDFGTFDTSFRIAGDYDFLLRALVADVVIEFCESPIVAGVAATGVSSDPKKTELVLREFEKARIKNGLPPSPRFEKNIARFRAKVVLGLSTMIGPKIVEVIRRWIRPH